MRDIHQTAKMVVAWLRPAADDSDLAIAVIGPTFVDGFLTEGTW